MLPAAAAPRTAVERSPGPWWLRLIAPLPALLLAVFVVIWDVGRTAPPGYGCGESEPPRHDAAVAAFRDGASVWHTAAILLCLATVVALSTARSPQRVPGGPTLVAAAVIVLLIPISLGTGYGVLFGVAAAALAAPGLLIAHPGAGAEALLAVPLLLAAAAAGWLGVAAGRHRLVAALVWWLLLFAAGHLTLILAAGSGPIVC